MTEQQSTQALEYKSQFNSPSCSAASAPQEQTALKGDLPYYALLILLVVAVFRKTIFLGLPISHFFLMAEWDSMFAQFRTGFSLSTEASTVLHFVPTYLYIAQQMHAGHIPLWNALNAFGTPLLGDIQSCFLSPFRLLFDIWPSLYFYNLELAALPAICCTSTFALARALGINRAGAILAAISYGLCPYFLWHLELWGAAYALSPLVSWLFRRAAQRGTAMSAVAAGIAAGILVLSSHPEQAFFAISGAALLMFCSSSGKSFVRQLAITGFSALCVSAPVLFPFVEFLKNSDCYKYGQGGMWPIPWQALFYNLATPGFGAASPFMGILVLPLIPFAFCRKTIRRALPVLALWLAFLFITAELWPLSLWCYVPPLSLVITLYAGPVFLLASALLAGLGLEAVVEKVTASTATVRSALYPAVAISLVCLAPWVLKLTRTSLSAASFDLMLPPMSFDTTAFRLSLVLCIAAITALFIARRKPDSRGRLGALLIALSFAGMCPLIAVALPARAPFSVPPLPDMKWLADQGQRIVACGGGVAKPNMNMLYGVDEVGITNPMSPKRYLSFIGACGGSMADATFTQFSDELSRTIDLASVKFVLSQGAVSCVQDRKPAGMAAASPSLAVCKGLSLNDARLWMDPVNHQGGGTFKLLLEPAIKDYALRQYVVVLSALDQNGKSIWASPPIAIEKIYSKPVYAFAFPIAQKIPMEGCRAAVNVFDLVSARYLLDKPAVIGMLPQSTGAGEPHFRLLREIPGGNRLYENTSALPRAYIVPSATVVGSDKEALAHITNMDFDPRQTVILEQPESTAGSKPGQFVPLDVDRADPSVVRTSYQTKSDGYLVLTDSFYPGWNGYIDGRQTSVLRANYMFRAISAPAGNHTVEFKFQPVTFASGLMLCFTFWVSIGIALLRRILHD